MVGVMVPVPVMVPVMVMVMVMVPVVVPVPVMVLVVDAPGGGDNSLSRHNGTNTCLSRLHLPSSPLRRSHPRRSCHPPCLHSAQHLNWCHLVTSPASDRGSLRGRSHRATSAYHLDRPVCTQELVSTRTGHSTTVFDSRSTHGK